MMRVLASLSNRIFLASALLAALSIAAALFFVRERLTAETQRALIRDVQSAANIVDQQQAEAFETFARSARLLADLPRFKAAVDTGDAPTVQPVAEAYLEQLGADVLRVHDRRGAVLASAGNSSNGVVRVVEVPILVDQDQLGVLTVGYRLDDDRARELGSLTGAEIAFASGGQILVSTLGAISFRLLDGLAVDAPPAAVRIGQTDYVAMARALHPEAAGRPASVVVLHSRTERMRTLGAIQTFLGGLAVGSVMLAVVLSFWVARTVTKPLATIRDHMRRVAESGDLTQKVVLASDGGWDDEDARVLARTFNSLTEAIARFQREAAQRDRLSALGRLSTVIAHEVRNPLMIIKGALRTITRPGTSEADLKDAAGDIDEEIARLNRLVNDVLDFARPIRFDCAPTDVNAVCEDAVRAVTLNGHPPPSLTFTTPLPLIVTDRERLRTVLVNLLTNAQHAVEGAPVAGDGRSRIALSTEAAGEGRVVLSVRDRGPGIAADDLPRIFDPYFTTKRGGTGLGLPIAKNIIDGLGGAIRVTSTPGRGTEMRIELPLEQASTES